MDNLVKKEPKKGPIYLGRWLRIFGTTIIVMGIVMLIASLLTNFDTYTFMVGINMLVFGILFIYSIRNIDPSSDSYNLTNLQSLGRAGVILLIGFIGILLSTIIEYIGNTV